MLVGVFDTHEYEKPYLEKANQRFHHELKFFPLRLTKESVKLAQGFQVVSGFVNDDFSGPILKTLYSEGTRMIALRSAGFNNVDMAVADQLGIIVSRVPEYSPQAVAEHAMALTLSLNRKIHRAYNRVREGNFSLEGLVGFDLFGKTVGIVGLGRIGMAFARIAHGFGCRILAYDKNATVKGDPKSEPWIEMVELKRLYQESDIISLHVPLNPETFHLINSEAFQTMKQGVFIVNTGRGALIDTHALIENLKTGRIGAAGLDVYEEEEGVFFHDLSNLVLQDDVLARLLTFPNVLLTSHQGFLTQEALMNIADTTLAAIENFAVKNKR